MAEEKKPPAKPFTGGIISQTSGKAAETIQHSYANEITRGRVTDSATIRSSEPKPVTK